jgi:hypothetical protein
MWIIERYSPYLRKNEYWDGTKMGPSAQAYPSRDVACVELLHLPWQLIEDARVVNIAEPMAVSQLLKGVIGAAGQ